MLSVIMPIYNEERYIVSCMESILQQDYPQDDLEVVLVDGMSTDRTRELVRPYTEKYPFVRLIDNPHKIVPYAMNLGIMATKGEVVMRLDAHARYATNYFSAITAKLREYDADNVGCVCRTEVLNKNAKSLAIREVLCNKFGVGNATFRTGIDRVRDVDTVPFGCWPRRVFEKYGLYNVTLVRNQDIELNKRIVNGGGRIIIIPDTYCTYMARETFSELAKNNYGNGKWNILTVYFTHNLKSISLRHLIPLMFVLGILVPLVVGLFWHPALLLSLFVVLFYLVTMGFVSLRLAAKKQLNFIYLLMSFVTLHCSYGWGSLVGILSVLFKAKSVR